MEATTRRPDFFIVGAPKAGTTSLHEYLAEHPQIYMSPLKEPDFFAPDVVGTRRERRFTYPTDYDAYLALFGEAGNASRVGEASTTYLMSRVAPGLVRDLGTDTRAIAVVRNPVELVHSLFYERLDNGVEATSDFSTALALDAERTAGRAAGLLRGYGAAYRDNALQGEQIERWRSTLGTDRLCVLVFDDFVADTAAEYERVLRFLGVDSRFRPRAFAVHNAAHRRRAGPVGLVIRSSLGRSTRRALQAALSPTQYARLTRRIRESRLVRARRDRPPLAAPVREELVADFRPDVRRLGEILGRDLEQLWFPEGAHSPTAR
jgi:Sulfotransferase family